MKAVILVGGYGTRLRPLSLTCPKPLVPFANKPILFHQIDALAAAGVTDVVLAVSYQPAELVAAVAEYTSRNASVNITLSQEDEPLGTAGPLALLKDALAGDEAFFMLNADVSCRFPFAALRDFHAKHGGEATICTTPVDDPSKYGVVVADAQQCVERFVEKPQRYVGNQINAGIYCLSPAVLKRIELRPTSIERDVFPRIAADKRMYRFELDGYWMDIGQPADYITGTRLYLTDVKQHASGTLVAADGEHVVGNVLVHPSAKIGANCRVGPDVVLGANVVLGDGVRIANTTVMEGARIGAHALVKDSIVGWNNRIGRWCRVEAGSVTGDDVALADEVQLVGVKVLPHKGVKASVREPTVIM